MDFHLKDASGKPLQARVELEGGRLVLHSRSGRSSTSPGRNPQYVAAFDALFDRINVPEIAIDQVLLDSAPAQAFPEKDRLLATREDFQKEALVRVKNQIRTRMRQFGRKPDMPSNEGNANKRIRIDTSLDDASLVRRLRLVPAKSAFDGLSAPGGEVEKLPHDEQRRVRPEHVYAALERLAAGETAENFGPSRNYDAVTSDGRKFAPKKVFGLALEEALGIEAFPGHFHAGWGEPCFDILENSGLWIVSKGLGARRPRPSKEEVDNTVKDLPLTDEERTWVEGNPKIVSHLKKERKAGLAKSKRDDFIKAHGKLFCERCHVDPLEIYGPEAGHACIEVHHDKVHVADMAAGHETELADLRCLCANCHRVLHRALSLGVPFQFSIDATNE